MKLTTNAFQIPNVSKRKKVFQTWETLFCNLIFLGKYAL
jgi:hypothetical protein